MAVTITESARNRLKQLISNRSEALGVILEIKSGGCSGYKFSFDYLTRELIDDPKYTLLYYNWDEVESISKFIVAVHNQSCSMIEGLELDYVEDNFGEKFTFNNAKSQCGCGKSFGV